MQKVTRKIQLTPELLEHLGRAVRTLYGSTNPDLQQEASLRTLQALRRNSEIRHPQAFVWKIVKDTVADHWRSERRDSWGDMASIPERFVASRPDIDWKLDRNHQISQIREGILDLSSGTRGPVYLYYVESYPVDTIARIYGKSPSAVKMALHRGRRQLLGMFGSAATNKSRASLR